MAEEKAAPAGPDLAQGVARNDFTGETLLGHVGDQDVLLVRAGPEVFAIDAHCSHYHGPLAEGLVVGASIRCNATIMKAAYRQLDWPNLAVIE